MNVSKYETFETNLNRNKVNSGRRKSVRTLENIAAVQNELTQHPNSSASQPVIFICEGTLNRKCMLPHQITEWPHKEDYHWGMGPPEDTPSKTSPWEIEPSGVMQLVEVMWRGAKLWCFVISHQGDSYMNLLDPGIWCDVLLWPSRTSLIFMHQRLWLLLQELFTTGYF